MMCKNTCCFRAATGPVKMGQKKGKTGDEGRKVDGSAAKRDFVHAPKSYVAVQTLTACIHASDLTVVIWAFRRRKKHVRQVKEDEKLEMRDVDQDSQHIFKLVISSNSTVGLTF